jgi:DNA gyrase subunit A
MLFTDTGRVHSMKAYRIPEAGRTSKGSNIVNIIDIAEGEKITAMLSVPDLESEMDSEDCGYLVMVTERGVVKRTKLSEFRIQRKGGKIALTLDDGDRLKFVAHTKGNSDVMIATRNGYAARFTEDQVRSMGRSAAGVRGISLRDGDLVAGACILERDEAWAAENKLITITEGGFGKRMEPSEFEAKGRGIMGVIAQKITDKTGALCGISVVKADEDIMMITNDGTIIRTPADGIPLYGRPAAGVIVMKLYDGAKLVNFALTEKEKEEDEAAPAESDVIEGEAAEITDEAEEIPADADDAENAESEPGTDE